MTSPLAFQWGVATVFGWGVYGLNLLRHWPRVSGKPAYCAAEIQLDSFRGMDAMRLRTLAPILVHADQMKRHLMEMAGRGDTFNGLVLHSIGNRFSGSAGPGSTHLRGLKTFGATFIEDTFLPQAKDLADRFNLVVAGSTWNEELLRANGVTNVTTVIQGIDPSLFHPGPAFGANEDRFAVFSGGKLEHRKGQDLVLLAFRAFAERHPDALLVTAWNSPWHAGALSLNRNQRIAPITLTPENTVSPAAWAAANGIRPEQFIDLGSVPNHFMGQNLREMDVAVFPNRCEGGTNLVAMECMACGVPAIVANNTGQKDLVNTGAVYTLGRQSGVSVPDLGTDGWGESDVEEIVEALETVYRNRDEARRRGAAGAAAMADWSWANQVDKLYRVLTSA